MAAGDPAEDTWKVCVGAVGVDEDGELFLRAPSAAGSDFSLEIPACEVALEKFRQGLLGLARIITPTITLQWGETTATIFAEAAELSITMAIPRRPLLAAFAPFAAMIERPEPELEPGSVPEPVPEPAPALVPMAFPGSPPMM